MSFSEQHKTILETLEIIHELQLKTIRQLLGKADISIAAPRKKGARRQSSIDFAVQILTDEQRPIHVDELVDLLRERFGKITDRDSLSSALAKKHKQNLLVQKVAPATFALLEE